VVFSFGLADPLRLCARAEIVKLFHK
jgi:hypothetical protein